MTPAEVLSLFRTEMNDSVTPYLWSDAEVYAYMDDAQRMFCRYTDGIADATTSAVCTIAVAQNATWLTLHEAILKIRAITRASDGRPIDVINFEDMAARGIRLDGTTGPIDQVIVGMEENKLRAVKTVSLADTLNLVVFRLPLTTLTGANGQTLEIPAQHHPHLLLWMKRRAYLKQDSETYDEVKSIDFENAFRAYCAQAKQEQGNKRHKVRTVAYGGI